MRLPIAVLCACIAAASGAAAQARSIDYPGLVDASNFPAHVQAIHFGSNTIDATHSVSYGAWTVSFGAQPPIATYTNNGIAQVGISNLACTNSVVGTASCGMSITKDGCAQSLDPKTGPTLITCPESLDLGP